MKLRPLSAFQGVGIELEYMIVERESLSPLPIADRLLQTAAGSQANQVDRGLLGWSNELVLHVIEVKNLRPSADLGILPAAFQEELGHINRLLDPLGAVLMPGAMHPWMDPARECHLWPHDNADLYRAYGRIFDCKTHGWANLQSMHINLPFAGDAEFARLHAAIRLVLPILPALAASSPFADGRDTGFADFRMEAYRTNAGEIASIAGQVVPETVASRTEYEQTILAPMYRDIAPHDPQHLLQYEWLNSRGAIARFDRNTIEIRVLDTQECVPADLAVAAVTVALVKTLYQAADSLAAQQAIGTDPLAAVMRSCILDGEQAGIADRQYLALLGYPGARCTAQQLWRHLLEVAHGNGQLPNRWLQSLRVILNRGSLAQRLRQAAGDDPTRARLQTVYRRLCDCLQQGRMFEA
jgi:gamma-glutamyl:cysteine ligase YbdK (ATP-grasp superfamily)